MLHDAVFIAERVIRMVKSGTIETQSGKMLPAPMDTICVHGDSAESVAIARTVRTRLQDAGITLKAFA